MNIKVCDECLAQGVLKISTIRIGFAHGLKVDVCKDHVPKYKEQGKEVFDKLSIETIQKANDKYYELAKNQSAGL